jgi:Tfp pilus assembly protein PilN
MIDRSSQRGPFCAGMQPDGFNLFPYRRIAARRRRRRMVLELAFAAMAGGAIALGEARIERHRAAANMARHVHEAGVMRAQLARLAPRLMRAGQFESQRMRDSHRGRRLDRVAARRQRVAVPLESVGRIAPGHPGVSLRTLEVDRARLTLDGAAADVQAFARWLVALREREALVAPRVEVLEREGASLRFLVRAVLDPDDEGADEQGVEDLDPDDDGLRGGAARDQGPDAKRAANRESDGKRAVAS